MNQLVRWAKMGSQLQGLMGFNLWRTGTWLSCPAQKQRHRNPGASWVTVILVAWNILFVTFHDKKSCTWVTWMESYKLKGLASFHGCFQTFELVFSLQLDIVDWFQKGLISGNTNCNLRADSTTSWAYLGSEAMKPHRTGCCGEDNQVWNPCVVRFSFSRKTGPGLQVTSSKLSARSQLDMWSDTQIGLEDCLGRLCPQIAHALINTAVAFLKQGPPSTKQLCGLPMALLLWFLLCVVPSQAQKNGLSRWSRKFDPWLWSSQLWIGFPWTAFVKRWPDCILKTGASMDTGVNNQYDWRALREYPRFETRLKVDYYESQLAG